MGDDNSSVRVAVRIRPQLPREIIDACKTCVNKTPEEPQVWIGSNKAFTYDFVYDIESQQEEIYSATVEDLIEGCFEGYNATVLAYGQTGSGKTYTMGTGFDLTTVSDSNSGIIPRAVKQLFSGISARQESANESGITPPEFKVSAQFMELYNEDILDLFDNATCGVNKSTNNGGPIGGLGKRSTSAGGSNSAIRIHEDANGNIYTVGVTSRNVHSEEETMQCLKQGAFNRTTASTNMNDQSSRSHAIFTLYIQQQRQSKVENPFHLEMSEEKEDANKLDQVQPGDFETLTAKFHFVDLAGSERLKRTGATGDRAKEGISINCGLLALGNVISALGDTTRRVSHVPYRDSKLTRLLQDSLGGNSRTLMIACVSPSDRDFMETLNTLKYANRARNIKNRVTANQDKTSRTILMLRQEIQNLQFELMEYRQGKRIMGADGTETTNDMYHENTMLSKENQNLRTRIKAMQETIDVLTAKNSQLLADKEMGGWIKDGGEANNDITAMVQKYITEVEELRAKLCESEQMCEQMRKETARVKRVSQTFSPAKFLIGNSPLPFTAPNGLVNMSVDEDSGYSVQELIDMAKKDLEKNKEERRRKTSAVKGDEDKDANSADDEDDGSDIDADEDEESESDTESDDKVNEELDEELVELTSEISLKQKLIEELETSQKRLHMMKQQYETKLIALEHRIQATQEERDKVLKNMGGAKSDVQPEKINKIKQEYQDKLGKLQGEVKKLKTAQKEHAKLLKNQMQYERQVEKLKSEVLDMKRSKVRLVQKMKEESVRHREMENRRTREMSTMKKQSRKHESKIKSLEAEKRLKENALKRKTEEVSVLRRNQRRISMGTKNSTANKFSAKMAKSKWQHIEAKISKVALNKQAVSQMENDMDRWLKEREKLSHKLERMRHKRKRLVTEKGASSSKVLEDLDDQIENLTSNVNYLHENIVECQQNIMQMEQAENPEEDEEESILAKIVNIQEIGLDESKYLLEKLLSMTVNQCCLAMQKEGVVKEVENRMNQASKQNTLHQQLLQHMIEQQDLDIYDLMLTNEQGEEESDSDSEDLSLSMTVSTLVSNASNPPSQHATNVNLELMVASEDGGIGSDSSVGRREKARRKMTTKEDLLFNDTDMPAPASLPPVPFQRSFSFNKPGPDLMTRSRSFVKSSVYNNHRNRYGLGNLDNDSDIMTQSVDQSIISRLAPVYQPSPVMGRRSWDRQRSTSPRSTLRKFNSAAKLNDQDVTPPGSPPSYRRSGSRDETGKNVFHRLVAGTTIGENAAPGKGAIHPFQGRIAPKSPLICSNVAEGHNKSVLSVFATDELLFSASKDRTVKVWDLCRKEEVHSLGGHPNNVVCVKYAEATRMAFTVSSAFIKVWDLRMSNVMCVKTLSSSGLTTNGPVQLVSSNRTLAMPPGETAVTDIALSPSGYSLFSAAADKVRIWDLRKFHSIGKLSGGHQAAVMCLTTGGDYVITGSKDHTVKVFNVTDGRGGVVAPTASLEPPHYDGIECLALQKDTLFSASRDMCIKKWNLRNNEVVRSLNNAHKDWICGLCFLPGGNTVVSGCRAGYIKLWSTETCALVGEMKAHNSTINTITANNNHLFTGSNDGSIGIWRIRSNYDKSPDSESS